MPMTFLGTTYSHQTVDMTDHNYAGCYFHRCKLVCRERETPLIETRNVYEFCTFEGDGWPESMAAAVRASREMQAA